MTKRKTRKNTGRAEKAPLSEGRTGAGGGGKLWIFGGAVLLTVATLGVLLLLAFCKEEKTTVGTEAAGRIQRHFDALYALNPRHPGAPGHDEALRYQASVFEKAGLETLVQTGEFEKNEVRYPVENVIGRFCPECSWRIVIGAHYDTRRYADSDTDPANRIKPMPGANDATSGAAVLLTLAEGLARGELAGRLVSADLGVDIVLFDAEEGPKGDSELYILGSILYVQKLSVDERIMVNAAVVIDMIGDRDLSITVEPFSQEANPGLVSEIWSLGRDLEILADDSGVPMLDDHRPFLDAGIPAVLLIDFTYPPWHTLGDTPDKVSFENMSKVLTLLERWLAHRAKK